MGRYLQILLYLKSIHLIIGLTNIYKKMLQIVDECIPTLFFFLDLFYFLLLDCPYVYALTVIFIDISL